MQEYIFEKDGRKRKASKVICSNCRIEFLKANKNIKDRNYCSMKCVHESQITTITDVCSFCGSKFKRNPNRISKSTLYFCSRKCKDTAQRVDSGVDFNNLRPRHYGNGYSNYQERAYKEYGEVCNRCGYCENKSALQVHHIDKNRENNSIDNLEVLCANCHAIEHWG